MRHLMSQWWMLEVQLIAARCQGTQCWFVQFCGAPDLEITEFL